MTDAIARRFHRFAETEAKGNSPLYEALAHGVGGRIRTSWRFSPICRRRNNNPICCSPRSASCAARNTHGMTSARRSDARKDDHSRRDASPPHADQRAGAVRGTVAGPGSTDRAPGVDRSRRVGRSLSAAGPLWLCLCRVTTRSGRSRVFPCRASGGDAAVPRAHPAVVWRAGLDLNPLDVRDDDDMAWLETLVWPDQPTALARLRAAIAVARADPPRIVAGDLLSSLPALAAEAPPDATLVVFHTAVLAYVADPEARAEFRPDRACAAARSGSATKFRASSRTSPPPHRPDQRAPFCWRSTASPRPGPIRTAPGSSGSRR